MTGIRARWSVGVSEPTWKSKPKGRYAIWSCRDLADGLWNTEAEVPSGGQVTLWIGPDTSSACKFYRIEVE